MLDSARIEESKCIGFEHTEVVIDLPVETNADSPRRILGTKNLIVHSIDRTNDVNILKNNVYGDLHNYANNNSIHNNESLTVRSVISSEASTQIVDNRTAAAANLIVQSTPIKNRSRTISDQKAPQETTEFNSSALPLTKVLSTSYEPLPKLPQSPPSLTRSTLVHQRILVSRPLDNNDRSVSTITVVGEACDCSTNQVLTPPRLSSHANNTVRCNYTYSDCTNEENGPMTDINMLINGPLEDKSVNQSSSSDDFGNTTTSTSALLVVGGDDNPERLEGGNSSNFDSTMDELNRRVNQLKKRIYEEEATPEQTAFGKELLFRRMIPRSSSESYDGSDVLSTASEMGTVVGSDKGDMRLQELDDILASVKKDDSNATGVNEDQDGTASPVSVTSKGICVTPHLVLVPRNGSHQIPVQQFGSTCTESDTIASSSSSHRTLTIFGTEKIDKRCVDETKDRMGLSIPELVDKEIVHRLTRSDGGEDDEVEPTLLDTAPINDFTLTRNTQLDSGRGHRQSREETEEKPSFYNPSSSISSMAIRIGTNFSGHQGSTVAQHAAHDGVPTSISEPTTPLPLHSSNNTASNIASGHRSFTLDSQQQNDSLEDSKIFIANAATRQQHRAPQELGDKNEIKSKAVPVPAFTESDKNTNSPPTSFLLRSPGSLAHVVAHSSAKKKTNHRLMPSISCQNGTKKDKNAIEEASILGPGNFYLPLRIARSCFSFDDTTIVDDPSEWAAYSTNFEKFDPAFRKNLQSSLGNMDSRVSGLRSHHKITSSTQPHHSPSPKFNSVPDSRIVQSVSWDVGGSSNDLAANLQNTTKPRLSPFRRRSSRLPFRENRFHFDSSILRHENKLRTPTRERPRKNVPNNDFSPILESHYDVDAVPLMTPQRIEIEREDALDILSCLVERGISWKQEFETAIQTTDYGGLKAGTTLKIDLELEFRNQATSVSDIVAVVQELEELSLDKQRSEILEGNSPAHQRRKEVLSELLKSHEYALEMKRASQSASYWLSSIGRRPSPFSKTSKDVKVNECTETSDQQAAGESASEDIDLLTAKALLHSAQLEAEEKSSLADRLNEELAKCRAEIGRLKTVSQKAALLFRSPNRSILDGHDDDISATCTEVEEERDGSFDNASPILADADDSGFLDASFPETNEDDICNDLDAVTTQDTSRKRDEAIKLRLALDEANARIKKLESEINSPRYHISFDKNPTNKSHEDEEQRNFIRGDSITTVQSVDGVKINTNDVRDMENFDTEWAAMASPLPNPPAHGLRSPLVKGVLDQWTTDASLHNLLLSWMNRVLEGDDLESIPPLTLNSLDCQVRDGFILHILPILLRRPSIHVDVKSRIHRRTVYDVAVEVRRVPVKGNTDHREIILPIQQHQAVVTPNSRLRHLETTSASSDVGMASSVTNSSASTTVITNKMTESLRTRYGDSRNHIIPLEQKESNPRTRKYLHEQAMSSRMSYDEMAENMTLSEENQPGLFTSLGDAFSGLLTRKKSPTSLSSHVLNENSIFPTTGTPIHSAAQSSAVRVTPSTGGLDDTGDDTSTSCEDDHQLHHHHTQEPYHRVVSAPSGRIGVTFVEYRGHCMVSDVADDSPLLGWIFQSDVLIAIDEIPVSGMRVRDIIKILKDRTNRSQRALRVISGHAMNEINPHTSMIMDAIS